MLKINLIETMKNKMNMLKWEKSNKLLVAIGKIIPGSEKNIIK